MRHPTDRASRLLAIKRKVADGTYETPSITDAVTARLQRLFGWRDDENHDDKPLVHRGYTHELEEVDNDRS